MKFANYRFCRREDATIPEELREFLKEKCLILERSIFEQKGGRDGDLGKETMLYEIYTNSSAGASKGGIHIYTVIDDGPNGYAQLVSVINMLDGISVRDLELEEAIKGFLDKREFVSQYSSFKERPFGYKCFASYLRGIADLSSINVAFVHKPNLEKAA